MCAWFEGPTAWRQQRAVRSRPPHFFPGHWRSLYISLVGTCNLSNLVVSRADRFDFSSGFSSQLLGQAERGAGAAVYSHCAMPQGASCHPEPSLMSSAPVVSNLFTAHRRCIVRLVMLRNRCCPRSRRFHRLRRIHSTLVIFRNRSRSFSRLFLRQLSPDFHRLQCILLIAFSISRGDLRSLLPE